MAGEWWNDFFLTPASSQPQTEVSREWWETGYSTLKLLSRFRLGNRGLHSAAPEEEHSCPLSRTCAAVLQPSVGAVALFPRILIPEGCPTKISICTAQHGSAAKRLIRNCSHLQPGAKNEKKLMLSTYLKLGLVEPMVWNCVCRQQSLNNI